MIYMDSLYISIEEHLLHDFRPSDYLKKICSTSSFQQYPFDMLYKLNTTKQSPKYHGEGSVWNHTLLVVDEAAKIKMKSKNPKVLMWAALLHDIGKPSTTKKRKGRITSYDHDKVGSELSKEFLSCFTQDKNFIYDVSNLIRYHMQILFVINNLPFADIQGMKNDTDIEEVALLGLCDRTGRLNTDKLKEEKNIEEFLKKCKNHVCQQT